MALVVDRFDLHADRTYRGVEDFCVLNGRSTDEKYRGSYETAVLKRDVVTTTVYLPRDRMALTLDGSTRWPDAKRLRRLGETRMFIAPRRVRDILMRTGDALSKTRKDIQAYRKDHPDFDEVGNSMLEQWEIGAAESLKGS